MEEMKPKYIIIHSIAETILHEGMEMRAIEFLQSIGLSAHIFIDHLGTFLGHELMTKPAKHAGRSEWNGDTNLNKCSIGIELMIHGVNNYTDWKEAIKKKESFTDKHYETCATFCASICKEYNLIPKDAILLHSDVSGDNVRGKGKGKIDPGASFDWQRLVSITESKILNKENGHEFN